MVFFYSSFLFPCNFNSNLKMISKLLDLNPLFTFFIISLHVFAIQNNGSVLCKYCNNKVNLASGLTYPICLWSHAIHGTKEPTNHHMWKSLWLNHDSHIIIFQVASRIKGVPISPEIAKFTKKRWCSKTWGRKKNKVKLMC